MMMRNEIASGYQSITGLAGILNAVRNKGGGGGSGLSTANYIVAPNSTYTTIGEALAAATAAGTNLIQTVYVYPGTYNEDILIPDNVILLGQEMVPPAVIITGHISYGNFNVGLLYIKANSLTSTPTSSNSFFYCKGCSFTNSGTISILNANVNSSSLFDSCIFNSISFTTNTNSNFIDSKIFCPFNANAITPYTVDQNITFENCLLSNTGFQSQFITFFDDCIISSGSFVVTAIANYSASQLLTLNNTVLNTPVTCNCNFSLASSFSINSCVFVTNNTTCINFVTTLENNIPPMRLNNSCLTSGTAVCISSSKLITLNGIGNFFNSTVSPLLNNITVADTEIVANPLYAAGNTFVGFVGAGDQNYTIPAAGGSPGVTTLFVGNNNFWSNLFLSVYTNRNSSNIQYNGTTGYFINNGPSAYYSVCLTIPIQYFYLYTGEVLNFYDVTIAISSAVPTDPITSADRVVAASTQIFSTTGLNFNKTLNFNLSATFYFPNQSYMWAAIQATNQNYPSTVVFNVLSASASITFMQLP